MAQSTEQCLGAESSLRRTSRDDRLKGGRTQTSAPAAQDTIRSGAGPERIEHCLERVALRLDIRSAQGRLLPKTGVVPALSRGPAVARDAGDGTGRSVPISSAVGARNIRVPSVAERPHSTVTLFARLRGWSTSVPFATATW